MRNLFVAGITAFFLPIVAFAADENPARFQIERSGENFVRLNKQTGALSICTDKDGTLVCRMATEERAAYDETLSRLEQRVTALEKSAGTPRALPSDAEVDRTIGIMERMMKSFFGMAKELQRNEEPNALPQRT